MVNEETVAYFKNTCIAFTQRDSGKCWKTLR